MLSFDITDRHIRIIRGTEAHEKIKVSSAATIDLEEGLIVNGHIKDIPKIATMINDELRKKKMADKEAVVSISSNLVIFKELHIPKAKGTQLLQMVQNQMQHTMGIADDYSISYTIAGEVEEDGVQALKVLATACPFEVVDCFRKVFSMLGISLRSVAVACNTITRIILTDPKMKAKMPMLLVQIDPNFVSLNLYENNQLTFSRFASIDPVDYDNSPDYIYEAVNENIFRMFQFQKSRNGDNPIQNVVFYGDTTEYIRLTNALEQMDITTSLLGVPNNIGGYENFEFQAYANAIGAMFKNNKESERINLLEVDAAVGRSAAGASFLAGVGVAALVAVGIVAGVTLFFGITKSQYEADTAEIQAWID
ncbi:MAG: pilus assembly protein PilM, partial [Oscillospiraceae bacterium]|nr:pilus assembly protein PilM [Oscillospiraceae bacterium]